MLDDGIYKLTFETPDADDESGSGPARGDGLAVLRGRTVLGSDSFGGVFRGSYSYDANEDAAVIDIRLAIPPNGVLVTGYEAGPDGATVAIRAAFAPARPVTSAVVDVAGRPVAIELRFMGSLGAAAAGQH